MTQQEIKEIQDISRAVANEVYNTRATQYGVPTVPVHVHNDIDSPILPQTSVLGFLPLPATTGGVISSAVLNTQILNNAANSGFNNPSTAFAYPLNIIYGYGVGVHSAFEGGLAPEGVGILFTNAGTNGQVYFKIDGTWRGVNLDLTV